MSETTGLHFENSTPIFRVEDMARSLRFYVDQLGFSNAEWGSEEFTCVTRDDAGIYLCRGAQGRGGAWAWVGVSDVRALKTEIEARGVSLRMQPMNFPWALEIHVEDPDGNILRFGSEPEDEHAS